MTSSRSSSSAVSSAAGSMFAGSCRVVAPRNDSVNVPFT